MVRKKKERPCQGSASFTKDDDDRSKSWPTVTKLREANQLTQTDQDILVQQLGYLPGNAIRIAARVKDLPECLHSLVGDLEAPVVAQLYPIAVRVETKFGRKRKRHPDDKAKEGILMEPFPTLYWITHPKVKALISNLEKDGRGVTYEQRLESDDSVRSSMKLAHKEYAVERWEKILTDDDKAWLTKRKWHPYVDDVDGRGVAGSRHPSKVKCLHAHAAHYWSGNANNIFGKWVEQELCDEATRRSKQSGGKALAGDTNTSIEE